MAKLIEITGKAISGEWGDDDLTGEGIPVLRTTNFTNEGLVNYANVVTRDLGKKDVSKKYLRPGDIIIEKSGGSDNQPVGRVIYFDGPESTYLFNNFTGLLRVNDTQTWISRYIFYALFANYQFGGTRRYENRTTGLHNLKTDAYVSSVEIKNLALKEQRKIVETLDKLSNLISLRKQQLAKLDELVKARFVEMFGDPIENCRHLPEKTLGTICLLKAGITTPADAIHDYDEEYQIPCYGGNGIRGYVKESTQHGTYPIIGRQGALCGNVQLAQGDFYATEHAVLVTPLEEMNVLWLYYLLKYMDLYRYHTGAAQPGLAVKTLNTVEVPVADLINQKKFAVLVEEINRQKLTIQQSLDKLEVLKKSLMQEYFG